MTLKKSILSLALTMLLCLPLFGEAGTGSETREPFLAVRIIPSLGVPLGRHREVFKIDVGRDLSLQYALPFFRPLFLDFTFGFNQYLIRADVAASMFNFAGGLGVRFTLGQFFLLGGYLRGGGFFSIVRNEDKHRGGQALLQLGPVFGIMLKRLVSLDLEISYKKYFGFSDQMGFGLGLSFHFNK